MKYWHRLRAWWMYQRGVAHCIVTDYWGKTAWVVKVTGPLTATDLKKQLKDKGWNCFTVCKRTRVRWIARCDGAGGSKRHFTGV